MSRDIKHPANTGGDIGLWERALFLVAEGHQVTVMASQFAGAPHHETIEGIEVFRIGTLLSLWWRTFLFYMTHGRGKYDVVVVEGFGGSRIPRLTPLYVREPIITEWHQIHSDLFAVQYPRLLRPLLNLLERATAFVHRNTIVMARTEDWKEAFPRIGFKLSNIRVVPACIGDDWFTDAKSEKFTQPTFVWLGKFRRYKCPDHAIRALGLVVKSVPSARLILAGFHDDRPYEAELVRLAGQLGLTQAVEFRFNITEEEKRSLLDGCIAMVLPSTVEGFGIVVLEANARGIPVIASSGVPRGSVDDERNGLRYQFGDVAALAEKMHTIASNESLRLRLSANSRRFAGQFLWRDVCRLYEEVLMEAHDLRTTRARGAREAVSHPR
jgi:glycosyltransferase involved in cell wall biosynthesis